MNVLKATAIGSSEIAPGHAHTIAAVTYAEINNEVHYAEDYRKTTCMTMQEMHLYESTKYLRCIAFGMGQLFRILAYILEKKKW